MVRFYILKKDLNDATSFYVDVIEKAFEQIGEKVFRTDSIEEIAPNDKVLVITVQTFFRLYCRNRAQCIMLWFQGVCPEEALSLHHDSVTKWPRYVVYSWMERLALRKAAFLFFVSRELMLHYQSKYGYDKDNYYLMPCFNVPLNRCSFHYPGKYETPSFVYAGSLSRWQCVDETLQLFAMLEQRLPHAVFTLLTGELEKGEALCRKYGLKKIEIKYVPLVGLGEELSKYKYGLLLREENVINRVATPTKFNSYLASGVIPVYSDVMSDFKQILPDEAGCCIRISDISNCEEMADTILRFEQQPIKAETIEQYYETIFQSYYSTSYHIARIAERIPEWLKH